MEHKLAGAPEVRDFPLHIKTEAVSDDGHFEGYGSVFGGAPDSYGDVIAPGAFHETIKAGGRNGNGIALLWQHSPDLPLGVYEEIREDSKGLFLRGLIDKEATPNGIPVFSMLKRGAVKGLSIGFRVVKSERDETTGIRTLKQIELWEVSLVTFPALTRATVTSVKDVLKAKTPREMEHALREAGFSNSAAKYMVGLCRDSLLRREGAGLSAEELLGSIRELSFRDSLKENINH